MAFNSFSFIFIFLPIFVFLQNIIRSTTVKNICLFLCFIIFYSWTSINFVPLIIFSALITYLTSILITKYPKFKLFLVIIFTIFIIGILGYYKYTNFAIRIINKVLHQELDFINLLLPLGISFFSFQALAYIYDLYQQKIKVDYNFIRVLVYLTFFPTITSGPILRYEQLQQQLIKRNSSFTNIANGLRLFIIGLGKKVIIANNIALIANLGFGSDHLALNWQITWLAAIAYTLQIYYDFSGYSDMAIGVSKMIGFTKIPDNFNYPYISCSISEFWRRWHISLGSWFKDYIYIPLGGNRVGKIRWLINIFIIWAITGLWHGAAFTFILWGLYFGVIIALEKLFILKFLVKTKKFIQHLYSLSLIIIGWIIFNSSTQSLMFAYLKNLFNFSFNYSFADFKLMDILFTWPIFIFAILAATPLINKLFKRLDQSKWGILADLGLLIILVISIISIINNTYSPFIYFNF